MEPLAADELSLLVAYRQLEPTWRATIRTAATEAVRLQGPTLERRPTPGLRVVARNGRREP